MFGLNRTGMAWNDDVRWVTGSAPPRRNTKVHQCACGTQGRGQWVRRGYGRVAAYEFDHGAVVLTDGPVTTQMRAEEGPGFAPSNDAHDGWPIYCMKKRRGSGRGDMVALSLGRSWDFRRRHYPYAVVTSPSQTNSNFEHLLPQTAIMKSQKIPRDDYMVRSAVAGSICPCVNLESSKILASILSEYGERRLRFTYEAFVRVGTHRQRCDVYTEDCEGDEGSRFPSTC